MTSNDIIALLQGLGRNADEVATTLHGMGIRGTRGSCGSCPLANYLQRHHVPEPRVFAGWVKWRPPGDDLFVVASSSKRHDDAWAEFMIRFDAGRYSYLDDSQGKCSDTPCPPC